METLSILFSFLLICLLIYYFDKREKSTEVFNPLINPFPLNSKVPMKLCLIAEGKEVKRGRDGEEKEERERDE